METIEGILVDNVKGREEKERLRYRTFMEINEKFSRDYNLEFKRMSLFKQVFLRAIGYPIYLFKKKSEGTIAEYDWCSLNSLGVGCDQELLVKNDKYIPMFKDLATRVEHAMNEENIKPHLFNTSFIIKLVDNFYGNGGGL